RESALIADLMRGDGQLVATGGGAVLAEANRLRLRERGFVVHLQVSVAQQMDRLARDRSRPLLAVGDKRSKLESLATERGPIYRDIADLAFDADGLTVAIAAEQLGAVLEQRWQRTAVA
ncbi:MAG: shikimate kinase AroK, partial [Arenimonas sp.]|nr:shikimate kinase AroK [Arenimonas sp.]